MIVLLYRHRKIVTEHFQGNSRRRQARPRRSDRAVDNLSELLVQHRGAESYWAVCQYRGVDTPTVHELGGILTPEEWQPKAQHERGVTEMFDPTVAALEKHVTGE